MVETRFVSSIVGRISYTVEGGKLTELGFEAGAALAPAPDGCPVARQLDEYFRRERRTFDLELAPEGTEFQHAVWAELVKIPYGETRTYLQIAQRIGNPDAVRAVGAANGANPIALIIPCHRVIGSDGSLTGYAGGLDNKRRLLDFERGVASLFD